MIGIVILTYNTWDETKQCLESISKLKMTDRYQVYIVDNCSTNHISEECKNIVRENKFVFVRADKNRGYAAGNNIGIKRALTDGCEEIVITNNDIVFTENVFQGMKLFLRSNNKVGIVGPKVFLGNGELQQVNLGCKMTMIGKYLYILRKTPLKRLSRKFVVRFNLDATKLDKPKKVFCVSGCCFMITRECIEAIGLLDENTFLFEEENILGCKLENKCFEAYYHPEFSVIHKHGQSTKHAKAFAFACLVESEIYYCRKYLSASRIKILGIYLIRCFEYLYRSMIDIEYKKNMRVFFNRTLKMFWRSSVNLGE